MKKYFAFLLIAFLYHFSTLHAQVQDKIQWEAFMAKHDLVWEEFPLQWNEGAFTGNGHLGMMIYANVNDNRIDFHIGRQDVTDHRKAPDKKTSLSVIDATIREDYPRLSIGRMIIRPAGKIIGGTMRQDLWNAEIEGTIVTDLGEIHFKAFTPYDKILQVVEVESTEKRDGKYAPFRWEHLRGNANAPRRLTHPHEEWSHYERNPPARQFTQENINYYVQELLAGGDFATAWVQMPGDREGQSRLLLSTANEIPKSGLSAQVAAKSVLEAMELSGDELRADHRKWWHNFYQRSFLSIPDGLVESFYWIQLYKMATSSRPDGPAVDLFGPYFRISQWGGHWWNLNVQLTYWPVYASNHLYLGENLVKTIDENFDAFLAKAETAKGRFTQATLGDFTWLMHNYWMQYAYDGNWQALREKWLPKARRVANSFIKILVLEEDGKYHMPPTTSPEYIAKDGNRVFKNTNYNLALIHWLLSTAIEVSQQTQSPIDEVPHWQEVLDKLHEFPSDAHGLMIGSDQPVDLSHRHFSHLLALYPLYVLSPDDPEIHKLLVKSVDRWLRLENGKRLSGYSFTGAASLLASIGKGDNALDKLHQFLTGYIGDIGVFLPNTFYAETSGKSPCFETPMSGATAVMELLLQSWGGKIRVFPAVPDQWKESVFHQLRAQGGFLVSAERKAGQTAWVKIQSLSGEPCIVKIPDWEKAYQPKGKPRYKITKVAEGEFKINLKKGDEILLLPSKAKTDTILQAIDTPEEEHNLFGVLKGQLMDFEQVWIEYDEEY